MARLIFPALLLTLILFPQLALAASFDCAKAVSPVEKMICSDPKLSKADEQLAGIYEDALACSANPEEFKKEQINWLRSVRDACQTKRCLTAAYRQRIEVLSGPGNAVEFYLQEKTELGELYVYVKVHGKPPFRLIDFETKLPDSSRLLTVNYVRVQKSQDGGLEFSFTDNWGNMGKGTFAQQGKKYVLDLQDVRPAEEPLAAMMIRNYGTYEVEKSKPGRK